MNTTKQHFLKALLITCLFGILPAHVFSQTDGEKIYGKVVEIMDVDSYTYVQVNTGKATHWAAGPKIALKKGSMIAFKPAMTYQKFHSKGLNRDFDEIHFVDRFISDNPKQQDAAADPHQSMANPHQAKAKDVVKAPIKDMKKAKNGKTIAEIIKDKSTLAGKSVKVRGQVVKYTPKVMGKNWLHIQDSSTKDLLTISTDMTSKIGDVVVATGALALNKDLGYGYLYEVLLEEAKLVVE